MRNSSQLIRKFDFLERQILNNVINRSLSTTRPNRPPIQRVKSFPSNVSSLPATEDEPKTGNITVSADFASKFGALSNSNVSKTINSGEKSFGAGGNSMPAHSNQSKPADNVEVSNSGKTKENENLEDLIAKFRDRKPSPGTLHQLISMSKPKHRLSWGPHLQRELLIRIAHRLADFKELPAGLYEQKSVQAVVQTYRYYLQEISKLENVDQQESNREFVRLLTEFKAKDSSSLPLIAVGIHDWQATLDPDSKQKLRRVDGNLASQLDDLFTARLSIRMLIQQYCEYGDPTTAGKIERGLVVAEVVNEAIAKVKQMTLQKFGVCPDIVVEGNLNCTLTYVRSYLFHVLAELLKNSARATIEGNSGTKGEQRRRKLVLSNNTKKKNRSLFDSGGDESLPDIHVVIAGGKEDCVIKVSDEGGGIPRSDLDKIWSYQYTTSGKGLLSLENEANLTFRNSFYGSGYGLPIARVFAKYFGGDLNIISTEGWGTDAYVYINRIESSQVENLPD